MCSSSRSDSMSSHSTSSHWISGPSQLHPNHAPQYAHKLSLGPSLADRAYTMASQCSATADLAFMLGSLSQQPIRDLAARPTNANPKDLFLQQQVSSSSICYSYSVQTRTRFQYRHRLPPNVTIFQNERSWIQRLIQNPFDINAASSLSPKTHGSRYHSHARSTNIALLSSGLVRIAL